MTQRATFAAGCFWGVESAFRRIPGVTGTRVGYTGGHTEDPSYYDVCSDTTGHAEAVEVEFDPEQVSYEELLAVFWANHDPTTPNRQGPDVGSQYRSAVFFHSPEQEEQALKTKAAIQAALPVPVVTEVVPAETFFAAEDYHQQYFEKRAALSCHVGSPPRDGGELERRLLFRDRNHRPTPACLTDLAQARGREAGCDEPGQAGDREGELGAADVREPAGEQAADRREAGEDEEVQREHAPAETVGRGQLEDRLAVRRPGREAEPDDEQQRGREDPVGTGASRSIALLNPAAPSTTARH